jgi:hypothetical protein
MLRRVILLLAVLLATGIFAAGCNYEAKRHLIELKEYGQVLFLEDDGLGTVGGIR